MESLISINDMCNKPIQYYRLLNMKVQKYNDKIKITFFYWVHLLLLFIIFIV